MDNDLSHILTEIFLSFIRESKVLLSQRNGTRQKIVTPYEFASNRPRGTMCMIIFHRNVTTGETRRTLINKEKSMEELFVHGTRLFASCQRLDLTHSKSKEKRGERKVACLNLGKNIVNERRWGSWWKARMLWLWFDRGFETGLGYYLNENTSHVVNKYCLYSFRSWRNRNKMI